MSKTISTVGMTPFEVTIKQTAPSMFKFVLALAQTGAKVSSSKRGAKPGSNLTFIVWLNPMFNAMFENYCKPFRFQFIASEALRVDGTLDES